MTGAVVRYAVVRYASAALGVVAVSTALLFVALDEPGRRGVLVAAAIAWPVQVGAFGLVAGARGDPTRFFLRWGAGIALRGVVVVIVGMASGGFPSVGRAPLVLSVIGFFFVMLLMEPLFLKRVKPERS